MKIYSSDLHEITEVLAGNVLSVVNPNATGAAATDGFRIVNGNANLFLDGQGKQELHTNTISGRIPVAISAASAATLDGGTLSTNADGGTFINSSITQNASGHVTIQGAGSGSPAANLTVSGNLIVQGTTTNIETTDLLIEDKYIQVNRALDDAGTGDVTPTEDGGVLVTRAAAGEQPTGAASNVLGTHAGIRYNEGDNRWEVATAVPDTGGADGDWTAIPLTGGNAGFFTTSRTIAAGSANTTFTITASDHGLSGSTFSVQVYDLTVANTKTQIIPENIGVGTLASGSGGAGASLEGTITVTMPADASNARTFHIAVTG